MGSFRHHGCDVRGQAFAEDPLPTTLGALEREPTDAFKRRCELLQSVRGRIIGRGRSEEHTSELQSLMRISYAVFCLKKKNNITLTPQHYKTHKSKVQIHNTQE